MADQHRVAIVFPADAGLGTSTRIEQSRFASVATALSNSDIEVVGVPYADEFAAHASGQLLQVDGVLVWINPITGGRDRTVLNQLLAEAASAGVFVSAHPDVIAKMGTKEVLYRTRHMGWGCDTRWYASLDAMRSQLPLSLGSSPARVLKRSRGQSGDGVWKVELADPRAIRAKSAITMDSGLRVRHAKRGSAETLMTVEEFASHCRPYFSSDEGMIDQAYQSRLPSGMVRCYLVRDRVAGFGEQLINALHPGNPGAASNEFPQPGPRLYFPPTRPDFQRLKSILEREWLDQLCSTVGIEKTQLPVLWDADFLYGEPDANGADTYVLCEINVSSVHPFPDDALAPLVAETLARLHQRR